MACILTKPEFNTPKSYNRKYLENNKTEKKYK